MLIGRRLAAFWVSLGAALIAANMGHAASVPYPCEQEGAAAEKDWGIPDGLLLAIGRVESGQWDTQRGQTVPWPWSVDVAGQGTRYGTRQDAVQATGKLLDGGMRNVDVGCFQISLLHHPGAFSDTAQAFDPRANAQYAARFLADLRARLGTWEAAVAAYHSAEPARGTPYRELVFAHWHASSGWRMPDGPASMTMAGVRVWTPSAPGEALSVISIGPNTGPGVLRLPRIVNGASSPAASATRPAAGPDLAAVESPADVPPLQGSSGTAPATIVPLAMAPSVMAPAAMMNGLAGAYPSRP